MSDQTLHSQSSAAWDLVRRQHGVISTKQLLRLGFSHSWIKARVAAGRLHRMFRGVYAVGRPEVGREGWWMAAVLASGDDALLSHGSGAALYGIRQEPTGPMHVSVPLPVRRSRDGIVIHPRKLLAGETTERRGIPVVSAPVVLVDLAASLRRGPLETAINEADARGILTVPDLRAAVERMSVRPGRKNLRETIDRRTFRFTRSALERVFIPLALSAGLPRPQTAAIVCRWEVDFYWPQLGLIVETDSLTYHRTPKQQDADRRRDQAHIAAGLTPLRFTHSQIKYEPGYVRSMLRLVARRLSRGEQLGRELEQVGHG